MSKTGLHSQDVRDATLTDADVAAANKDGVAGTASLRTLGTGAQQAAAGNAAPTAHATSHQDGGTDEIDVTGLVGAGGAPATADYLVGTAQGGLSAEIVVGATPGGELGGTWASPTVDATHAGSAHHDPVTVGTGLDVTGQLVELDLSEVAAGGELGGFLDAPTVDATHSGSTHSAAADAHIADTSDAHDASAISIADAGGDFTATDVEGALDELQADNEAHVAAADPHAGYVLESLLNAKGDLISASADNTPALVTVGADDTILMADAAAAAGLKWVAPVAPAAVGSAAVTGTGDNFNRGDHVHAHEAGHVAHDTIYDAAGDLVVGSGADTAVRVAITVPAANILEVLGVVNGETTASWKAVHDGTNPAALGAVAPGTALTAAHRDHVHPTTGLALDPHGAAQHTNITRKLFLPAAQAKLDAGTAANVGASPDLTGVVALAAAATQGCFFSFEVPDDWDSGVITLQPVWSPGATDAVAHTVRWTYVAKAVAAGSTVTAAGTTTAWTGASAARTVGVVVYDTATSSGITPAAAGDLFRFTIQRIGANAADSYVGVVNLLGVIVSYTANQ